MPTPEQRDARRAQRTLVDGRWVHPGAPHGLNGYVNYMCRCWVCGIAWTAACRTQRANRFAGRVLRNGDLYHPGAVHGTANGYKNYGCRCSPCRQANAEVKARQRHRRNRQ